MCNPVRKRMQRVLTLALLLVVAFSLPGAGVTAIEPAMGPAAGSSGIVCTTSSSPNPTFTLTARDGYIGTPDGNVIYMWGYANGNDAFQHPGPVLCVNEGDSVTIVLHNTLWQDVSIVFPGQQEVLADGAPAQPQFDGTGRLTSLTNVAAANGGSVTYSFVAGKPGTFLYESGTEPSKQVQMGLFGALVVRPPLGPNGEHYVYHSPNSQFNPDAEFLLILSEIDPLLHQAVERREPFNMNNYLPRYWLINGRGLPDTLAPNNAAWMPTQPYSSLARIHPYDAVSNPLPALTRYLSAGSVVYPFHPHGKHALVIGRDGRPLEGPAGEDVSYDEFSIAIGPGQTYDTLFSWYDAEAYNAATNPVPVTVPTFLDAAYGMYYSGSPYLGEMGPMPVGMAPTNECGEYYIIAHNHNLVSVMAWDFVMMGQGTFVRVDPPLPNMCP